MPKQTKPRYLAFGAPIVMAKPPGATQKDLVKALGEAAVTGRLPPGWDVRQQWKNGKKGNWKNDSVTAMLQKSAARGGDFNGIYFNRYLKRIAGALGVDLKEPRRATAAEIAADERRVRETSEKEAGAFEVLRKLQQKTAKFEAVEKRAAEKYAKRRAAALKGIQTRLAKAAKAAVKKASKGRKKR